MWTFVSFWHLRSFELACVEAVSDADRQDVWVWRENRTESNIQYIANIKPFGVCFDPSGLTVQWVTTICIFAWMSQWNLWVTQGVLVPCSYLLWNSITQGSEPDRGTTTRTFSLIRSFLLSLSESGKWIMCKHFKLFDRHSVRFVDFLQIWSSPQDCQLVRVGLDSPSSWTVLLGVRQDRYHCQYC